MLDVYDHPPGYELECGHASGETLWLESFTDDEVSLELVGKLRGLVEVACCLTSARPDASPTALTRRPLGAG